jgi:hypothetical protein
MTIPPSVHRISRLRAVAAMLGVCGVLLAAPLSAHAEPTNAAWAADDFTLVVLPDTQCYTGNRNGGRPEQFVAQTDWIVSNRLDRRIAYVAHVGDVIEYGDEGGDLMEWDLATNALYRLENPATTGLPEGIPYGIAFGNHDGAPAQNLVLGPAHFAGRSYYGGCLAETGNRFDLFRAGGIDFLVLYLDYFGTFDDKPAAWAREVLRSHSNRRAIVVAHSLLNPGQPATFTPEGAQWVEELQGATNIVLWLCGHRAGEGWRTVDETGRSAPMLLADYQMRPAGGDGWLRLLRISPSSNRVYVSTYSPVLNRWETDASSQFDVPCALKEK